MLWQHDARYFYYRHGPLARTQLGELHVQGIDYAYTLQGWLKAINPSTAAQTGGNCPPDMGGAGVLAAPGVLTVNDRNATPPTNTSPTPQYIARQQIVFDLTAPGFQSQPGDNFSTLIDANATTTGTGSCNADPNAVDLYDDDGTNNKLFARDAHALALNYYNDGTFTDYSPIGTIKPNALAPALPIGENHPLYNGNISSMAVNIRKLAAQANTVGAAYAGPMLYNYGYDQLNRIVSMDAWQADGGYNTGSLNKVTAFAESYTYDGNGNIMSLNRNGANTTGKPLAMDNLRYSYINGTNQLDHVNDQVASGNYANDIDDQPANNYHYDAIGNMVSDNSGKIGSVNWTVYGKIGSIAKTDGASVAYTYDASGNRISKNANGIETWYVRDATGNVIATYVKGDNNWNSGKLTQTEVDIYGSMRLGLLNTSVNCDNNGSGPATLFGAWDATLGRGQKLFELTNHLGNVLATVTDRLVPVPDASKTLIDHNLPDVASANDYYSFGMAMPGRTFNAGTQYRYGFNGKMDDKDISDGAQDYGMRIYDARLGKFLSIDPLAPKYPFYTPYQFAGNKPISAIDRDGLEDVYYIFVWVKATNGKEAVLKLSGEQTGTPTGEVDKNGVMKYKEPFKIHAYYPVEAFGETNFVYASYNSEEEFQKAKASDFYKSAILTGLDRGAEIGSMYGDLLTLGYMGASFSTVAKEAISLFVERKLLQLSENVINKEVLQNLVSQNIRQQILKSSISAETKLTALEAGTPGAHYLSRHGAQTTLAQQLTRATTGLTPDGVVGRAIDASRFLSHDLELEAFEAAQAAYQPGMTKFTLDLGKTVGEGYLKNSSIVTTTTKVSGYYNTSGEIVTIFPKLR